MHITPGISDRLLYGRGSDGSIRAFTSTRVLSVPLIGPHDDLFGVSFPKEPKDVIRMARWALQRDRTSERGFHLIRPQPPIWGNRERWGWDNDLQPGAWYDPKDPVPPIHEHVHANADCYAVVVNLGEAGSDVMDLERLTVDGSTFGRIRAENDLIRRIAQERPRCHLLGAACGAGAGPAAREAAEYMHRAGFDRPIHAFTDAVQHEMTAAHDGGRSRIGVRMIGAAATAAASVVTTFVPPA